MASGRERKQKRTVKRLTQIGWASILQKDLSSVFTEAFRKDLGYRSKHVRRKIKAGFLMARNQGILSLLSGQSAGEGTSSGTQGSPSSQADESKDRSTRETSEGPGPVIFYRSAEFQT